MSAGLATKNWTKGKLQDLVFFQRGFDITKAQQNEGSVPVISSSGVTSYHSEAMARGPGVVIGRKGTLGSVHYCEADYWPHDTTLWSKDLQGNNPRFVYYYLHTINLKRFDVGNSNPTLNRNHIHDLPALIPPADTQDRIADILSAYDDLTENNRRRMTLLEDAARQLYREWFVRLCFPGHEHTRITNGVPEGWDRKRIADAANCVGGGTPSTSVSSYWEDGDVTWVTPTDVTRNPHFVLLDSEKKITEAGLQNSSAKLVPAHAVLMTSRASVGFFAVAGKEVCTNQGFISVVPHDPGLWPYYLFHLTERVEEIRAMGSGSTYPEVSRSKFRELEVLLPKHTLVTAFCEQATVLLKQIRVLKQQNQQLRAARDLLLPRLMSGEVAV
jgi:type I restriction enzyme, S subunit